MKTDSSKITEVWDWFESALSAVAENQADRLILWVPVCLGLGIATYFSLNFEPDLVAVTLVSAVMFLLTIGIRRYNQALAIAAFSVTIFLIGTSVATLRTVIVEAPILSKKHGPVEISGIVGEIQSGPSRSRLIIEFPDIPDLTPEGTPKKVRISVRQTIAGVAPGDVVTVRAVLLPPPRPVSPGAFDFGRDLFFRQIGAVGYSLSAVERTAQAQQKNSLGHRIERLRFGVSERIRDSLAGESGAVAAALMTGHREAISEETLESMRRSGLAHLLAISGLHIGLISVIIFVSVRRVLAIRTRTALYYPIKKWAAAAAVLGAFCYLGLTGGTPPTERAFIMISVFYLAVMLDRVAISMRTVAWAASLILLTRPEVILGASFQLSFAAVVALVGVYEVWARRPSPLSEQSFVHRFFRYATGVAATSAIATLATALFAAFHFQRIALYGIAANMIAVPLTAFLIMPFGLMSLVLMPIGLEGMALVPMGWGIDGVLATAEFVGNQSGSVLRISAFSTAALVTWSLAGLWFALWRGRMKYWAAVPLLIGGLIWSQYQAPHLLVNEEADLLAVQTKDGTLAFSDRRKSRFVREQWQRRFAQEDQPVWPKHGQLGTDPPIACDPLGCMIQDPFHRAIAIVRDPSAFASDCPVADVVVSLVPARDRCHPSAQLIDRFDLWREGTHALTWSADGFDVETVRQARGERPWRLYRPGPFQN